MAQQTREPGVADVMWQQIPVRVKMSMGARQAAGDNEKGYLHFTVGPTRRKPFKVRMQYDRGQDSYKLELIRCDLRTGQVEVLESIDDVYFDQLGEILISWEGRHLVS